MAVACIGGSFPCKERGNSPFWLGSEVTSWQCPEGQEVKVSVLQEAAGGLRG